MSKRIECKGWFLTYPRCDMSKEALLEAIQTLGVDEAIVAREEHEDGTPHLHAYFKLTRKGRKVMAQWNLEFDALTGQHGNYQVARNWRAVQKYCKKDGDYVCFNLDIEAAARKKRKAIIEDPYTAYRDGQIPLGMLGRVLNDLELLRNHEERAALLRLEGFIPNPFGTLMPVRSDKQKHYWVWSHLPNKGKTTWLRSLCQEFRCSWYNYAESFQNIHEDTQFLLFDEYSSAHLKVTTLNLMADGTYQYPRKGTTPIQVTPILIVCGNRSPEEVYPSTSQYILARFNVIEI